MMLNHLVGFYTHPKTEWRSVEEKHESSFSPLSHLAIISLIPAVVFYYASTQLGWRLVEGNTVMLSHQKALIMSVALYFGLMASIVLLGLLIRELSGTFDSPTSLSQSIGLAAYTATPLLLVGLSGLYPSLWFVATAGLLGLAYSVYLLFAGVPILMHIPREMTLVYASSVVACALVLMVILIAAGVIIWSMSVGPIFSL